MFFDDEEKMRDFDKLTKEEFLGKYSDVSSEEYDIAFLEHLAFLATEVTQTMEGYESSVPEYILQNKNDENDILVYFSDYNADNFTLINVYDDSKSIYSPEWDFTFDCYLYELLEQGYEIKWMDMGVHAAIWEDLNICYPIEVEHKYGVQEYLKYCKANGIDKELIKKDYKFIEDIPDAMKLLIKENKERER
jgi:hypothetical protein